MDGLVLLFQANFKGSNQSTAPDTDRAIAICWEISPLIGSTEKATTSVLQHALDRLTSPHTRLYKQLAPPIIHHNDRLQRLTRREGLTVNYYFMVFEQRVSLLNNMKCQSARQSARLKDGNLTIIVCACASETVRNSERLCFKMIYNKRVQQLKEVTTDSSIQWVHMRLPALSNYHLPIYTSGTVTAGRYDSPPTVTHTQTHTHCNICQHPV